MWRVARPQIRETGSTAGPNLQAVFRSTGSKVDVEQHSLSSALARFEPKIWRSLYEGPGMEERLSRRDHSWQGGPVAAEYLGGKYLTPRSPDPTRTRYRTQFSRNPDNARWLNELESAARLDILPAYE